MGGRLGIVLLFVLGLVLMVSDAQYTEVSEVIVLRIDDDALVTESEEPAVAAQNDQLCILCEQYATLAFEYLSQNKTQTEIMDALHKACSNLHSLEQQCLLLVDYYAPLFFMEVDRTNPEKFCKKVNLCEGSTYVPKRRSNETCSACHQAVVEILLKLKDPDTQLEIVATLLKACNKMENFAQQCKRLVFEYGPVILVNAEKFLETTDICTYIHACKSSKEPEIMQVHDPQVALSDS